MKKDWVNSEVEFKASSVKSTDAFLLEQANETALKNLYPSYVEEEFNVYAAKGKGFDYTELEKAQESAISTYKKIGLSGMDNESFNNLKTIISIWEKEAGALNKDDKDARINNEIAKGLYENMMYAYGYIYDFEKAIDAGYKAVELYGNFSNNRSMGVEANIERLKSRKLAADVNSNITSDIGKLAEISKNSVGREVRINVQHLSQLAVLENEYKGYVNTRTVAANEAEKKAWEQGVAAGTINPYEEYVTETATQGKIIMMTSFLGPTLNELPKEICNIADLKQISIVGNNIASIPAEIAQLKDLEVLNLSNNKITALPPEIGSLTKIRTLNLAGNPISMIPDDIKNCSSLKSVNLKESKLSASDQAKLAILLPNAKIKF